MKQPIDTAPTDGKIILIGDKAGNIAKAFWTGEPSGGMWAYPTPEGHTLVEQVDFEPTHWSLDARDFLDEADLTPPAT